MTEATNGQIKSKLRVADHGEVFTAEREVNAMLRISRQRRCTAFPSQRQAAALWTKPMRA